MPEAELRPLCHQRDPPLSHLESLAECLRVPLAYFQSRFVNVADVGNTQKAEIGKATPELAVQLGVCRPALEQAQQLVATKDEIIALLKVAHTAPN